MKDFDIPRKSDLLLSSEELRKMIKENVLVLAKLREEEKTTKKLISKLTEENSTTKIEKLNLEFAEITSKIGSFEKQIEAQNQKLEENYVLGQVNH